MSRYDRASFDWSAFRPTRVALSLIIANAAFFAVQMVLIRLDVLGPAGEPLSMVPSEVLGRGWVWQLVTSAMLHAPNGTGHLTGNMLMLWFFASPLEREEGGATVLRTYLLAGLAGSAFWVLLGALGHAVADLGLLGQILSPIWDTPSLGASGAVSGVTFYWLGRHYDEVLNFLFLGAIRGRTLMGIMTALELLGMLSYSNVGWGVHLAGMFTGAGLAFGWFRAANLSQILRRRRTLARKRDLERKLSKFEVIEGGRGSPRGRKPEDWVN